MARRSSSFSLAAYARWENIHGTAFESSPLVETENNMILGGAIVWKQALLMAVFATLGGFAGARLAKRLPVAWVRAIVIVTGVVMSVLFFMRSSGGG